MLTSIVLTIFGKDRPGLVESVAASVVSRGGNWLESRLLHLGGHFTGIVRVEIPDEKHSELLAALHDLEKTGLSIVTHEAGPPTSDASSGRPVTIEVIGHDRPGIVRAISRALASSGVNVEELTTERTSAPMSGEAIFKARADVVLPDGLDASALRGELERVAEDLMVDLTFRPAEE